MRHRFTRENCSVARALEVIGDWWTLLIVREALLGTRRFADFAARLPISRNILTRRLGHLVRGGVLARVDAGTHGTRYEYALTAMGIGVDQVMNAIRSANQDVPAGRLQRQSLKEQRVEMRRN